METVEECLTVLGQDPALKIVEGQKDKSALESLSASNILCISQLPFYAVIEKIEPEEEVIILTDFDFEGRKFFGKLRHECQRRGIKIKNQYREFLQKNTKIVHIESLRHMQSSSE